MVRRLTWLKLLAIAVLVLGAAGARAETAPAGHGSPSPAPAAQATSPVDAGRAAAAANHGGPAVEAPGGEAPAGETLGEAHAEMLDETHGETPGAAHGEAHAEHGEEHGAHPPTLVTLLAGALQGDRPEPTPAAAFLLRFQAPIFSGLIAIGLMTVLVRVATRRREQPGRLQMAVELVFEGLYNIFRAVIGEQARRYTPYLGTLFLFILINNLAGLVPFLYASTSVINTTVALAICTFLYVQATGIRENGILGYLHHMAGSPRSGMEWGFSLLLFPLHLLGEFIKPLSLSLRLYGNIFGEETLTATFIVLGAGVFGAHAPVGFPLQIPFMFLGMLTSTIQALVFTLLSTVYIALMLPHHDHGHEAEAGHGGAAAAPGH